MAQNLLCPLFQMNSLLPELLPLSCGTPPCFYLIASPSSYRGFKKCISNFAQLNFQVVVENARESMIKTARMLINEHDISGTKQPGILERRLESLQNERIIRNCRNNRQYNTLSRKPKGHMYGTAAYTRTWQKPPEVTTFRTVRKGSL